MISKMKKILLLIPVFLLLFSVAFAISDENETHQELIIGNEIEGNGLEPSVPHTPFVTIEDKGQYWEFGNDVIGTKIWKSRTLEESNPKYYMSGYSKNIANEHIIVERYVGEGEPEDCIRTKDKQTVNGELSETEEQLLNEFMNYIEDSYTDRLKMHMDFMWDGEWKKWDVNIIQGELSETQQEKLDLFLEEVNVTQNDKLMINLDIMIDCSNTGEWLQVPFDRWWNWYSIDVDTTNNIITKEYSRILWEKLSVSYQLIDGESPMKLSITLDDAQGWYRFLWIMDEVGFNTEYPEQFSKYYGDEQVNTENHDLKIDYNDFITTLGEDKVSYHREIDETGNLISTSFMLGSFYVDGSITLDPELSGNTTNLTTCGTLSTANETYYLLNNVTAGAGADCFVINDNDILLDCQGYTIFADVTGSRVALNSEGGSDNGQMQNCNLEGEWEYGVDIDRPYWQVYNIDMSNANITNRGMDIQQQGHTVENVTMFLTGTTSRGIYIAYGSFRDSSIRNIDIVCNNLTQAQGFRDAVASDNLDDTIFENINITDCGTGMYLDASGGADANLTVRNLRIVGDGGSPNTDAIYIRVGGSTWENIYIEGFDENGQFGIDMGGGTHDVIIDNVEITNSNNGIDWNGLRHIFNNIYIHDMVGPIPYGFDGGLGDDDCIFTNIDISDVGYGMRLDSGQTNISFINITIHNTTNIGWDIDGCDDCEYQDITIYDTGADCFYGDGSDTTYNDFNLYNCGDEGFNLASSQNSNSTNITINNTSGNCYEDYPNSFGSYVDNVQATNCGAGGMYLDLDSSDIHNVFINNTTTYGIKTTTLNNFNTYNNIEIYNTPNADAEVGTTTGSTWHDINLGGTGTVSFSYSGEFTLDEAGDPAKPFPQSYGKITRQIQVLGLGVGEWLFANISYADSPVYTNFIEDSITTFKRNATDWYEPSEYASSYGLDTIDDYYYTNITDGSSIFYLMGTPNDSWNVSAVDLCDSGAISNWTLFATNTTDNVTFTDNNNPSYFTTNDINLTGNITFEFTGNGSTINIFNETQYDIYGNTWTMVKSWDVFSKVSIVNILLRTSDAWSDAQSKTKFYYTDGTNAESNMVDWHQESWSAEVMTNPNPTKTIIYLEQWLRSESTNDYARLTNTSFNYIEEQYVGAVETTPPTSSMININALLDHEVYLNAFDRRNAVSLQDFSTTFVNSTDVEFLSTSSYLILTNISSITTDDSTITYDEILFNSAEYDETIVCEDFFGHYGYLEEAGLQVQTFDETTLANLTFNITIANSTSQVTFNNQDNGVFWDTTQIPSGDLTMDVSADGYQGRFYYTTMTPTTFTNLTAYLLSDSESLLRSFTVLNNNYQIISGAEVTISRFINNEWTIVGEKLTDDSGVATFFMNPSESYQVEATFGPDSSGVQTIQPTESQYTIIIETGEDIIVYEGMFDQVTFQVTPAGMWLPLANSTNIVYSVTSWDNDFTYFNMTLTDENSTVIFNDTSNVSSGGVIIGSINTTGIERVYGTFEFQRTGRTPYSFTKNWIIDDLQITEVSLVGALFQFGNIPNEDFGIGAKMLVVLILTTAIMGSLLMFGVSGFASAIVGASAITIATLFGWFPASAMVLIWLIVLGATFLIRGL